MNRVKKNDLVQIISGKEKGKTGKVLQVLPQKGLCVVDGLSKIKRHQKAGKTSGPSGIVEKNQVIQLCKVMPVDPKTGKRTRVSVSVAGDKKVRLSKKSGQELKTEAK